MDFVPQYRLTCWYFVSTRDNLLKSYYVCSINYAFGWRCSITAHLALLLFFFKGEEKKKEEKKSGKTSQDWFIRDADNSGHKEHLNLKSGGCFLTDTTALLPNKTLLGVPTHYSTPSSHQHPQQCTAHMGSLCQPGTWAASSGSILQKQIGCSGKADQTMLFTYRTGSWLHPHLKCNSNAGSYSPPLKIYIIPEKLTSVWSLTHCF